MYDPRLLSNAVGEIALPLASTAWADSNMRIQLGHRLLRASGSPIVCWGCGCQCRIGLSYLCLDQEGGGLSHGRGLRGGWRAVVGDTACEGGVHHRAATGLGWHEICHRENGFDSISQGNQRRCLGSGAEQASSDFRRWMCDITSVPSSPESISRYNSNTLVPPSHALSTFKTTPNRSQCTQRALPLLTQITSSGHQQQTLHPQ